MTTLLKLFPNLSVSIFAGNGCGDGCRVSADAQFTDIVQAPFPDGAVGGSAMEWQSPPDTMTMLLTFKTWTALERLIAVPSPSSPWIVSPRPDGAIGFQRQDVKPAGGDGGDVRQAGNLHRSNNCCGRAVAQFAVACRCPTSRRCRSSSAPRRIVAAGDLQRIVDRAARLRIADHHRQVTGGRRTD